MRRAGRLFEIIEVLRGARAPLPAHAIAAALEVHKRTVYRDIAALQALRVPIQGEAGVGYMLRPGFDLPPLMFTAEEVEALAVGLAMLGRTRDRGLEAAAARVRGKLAAVVPRQAGVIDALPLHVSGWTAVGAPGVDGSLLREAIRRERTLRFDYRDALQRPSSRIVRPLALTYWADSTVLAAWCELRAAFRHFRLDRMAGCGFTGASFAGEGARLRARLQAGPA